jgi:hypothetical protein
MVDRYTRVVLTVIAACLVYLCLVVSRAGTPLSAQATPQGATRPGLSPGPAEVVIVGWRSAGQDVAFPVLVRNTVTTAPSNDRPTRVVVSGWEDEKGATRALRQDAGLPVNASGVVRPGRRPEVGPGPPPR